MILTWPFTPQPLADQDFRLVPWNRTSDIPGVVHDLTASSQDTLMLEFTQVPENYTEAMAESFLSDQQAVRWAITVENRYCGNIEFRLESEESRIASVGYSISPWARGQGLAARALKLAAPQAFAQGVFRLELRAAVHNQPSRATAEKAGFTFEGVARAGEQLRGKIHDLAVYSRLATD
ncbi:GNAT family N-acetyltransferase [Rothia aerolata]|uniref:N-acetyltransferase domain-containing protein n=1 Tax=Rothia aerolata TaxID=1812262 RepID=A0A917INW4_9MICC|nr:GNAT family protein [Rothia aerolata]GGH59249.1 hypothetical protein GCM10007359_06290 [Rothia aerolata]